MTTNGFPIKAFGNDRKIKVHPHPDPLPSREREIKYRANGRRVAADIRDDGLAEEVR
jgi:hypothetical protein